jgi:hypothetical protein
MAHSLVSELAGLAGVDRRVADRRSTPRAGADRRTAQVDRHRQLALAADAMSGGMEPESGGLLHAADAAAGRLSARRRGLAA